MNQSELNDEQRQGPFPSGPISPDQFSAEELALEEAFVSALVSSRFPSLDVTPGSSFFEGWIRPGAVVMAAVRKTAERFRASMTLDGVASSSFADLDPGAVSSLLSNYLVSADYGETASGTVTVQMATSRLVVLPGGTVFSTEDGRSFTLPDQTEIDPLAMERGDDGTWFFRINLVAEVPGESGNLPTGEQLRPAFQIPGFIRAYSSSAFSGGRSGTSPSDIKSAVLSSMAARNLVSPNSLLSVLSSGDIGVDRVSVVGPYHSLMTRNRHGVGEFPVGGFEDVYVRTSRTLSLVPYSGTAIKQNDGSYSIEIPASAFPGHYYAASVRPLGALEGGSLEVRSFSRGFDPGWPGASSSWPLRTPNGSSTAFSMWQTSTVVFLKPEGAIYGDEIDVVVNLAGIPGVDSVQSVLSDPSLAQAGIDRMAKAFVPCVVSVGSVGTSLESGADRSSVSIEMSAAFSREVSVAHEHGGVRADRLVAAFMAVPGVRGIDVPLTISGTVFPASGDSRAVSSKSMIRTPGETALGYGPENVQFFPDPNGVLLMI